jgi:hypothetical protein
MDKVLKWTYYAFGGFVGFTCGVAITAIFYYLEQSGYPLMTQLGRNYGVLGRAVAEFVAALPYFGIVIGMVMVRMLFCKDMAAPDK